MANQSSNVVVFAGRKPVSGVLESVAASGAVREATTGQVVTLRKVWAVAAPAAEQAAVGTAARSKVAVRPTVPHEEYGFYRKYTERLLQRYVQMTMEAGRVPSMMGREVIGGRASSYKIHGFDDAVNFRLDVEKCLKQLEPEAREVIRRVAMQEYTQTEAAELMGVSLRTVVTRYGRSLDQLTGILLQTGLLDPVRAFRAAARARRG